MIEKHPELQIISDNSFRRPLSGVSPDYLYIFHPRLYTVPAAIVRNTVLGGVNVKNTATIRHGPREHSGSRS